VKVPEFKDAYPSFQLEDELFLNGGGAGECCGHIYWEDVPSPAQTKEGPADVRRRKERQPLKMEGVALHIWKVLEDGRCYTPRLERVELVIEGD
jgi:hypothetical protein